VRLRKNQCRGFVSKVDEIIRLVQAYQLSPERETPVLAVIANQVYCNSQKPGLNRALAAEAVAGGR